MKKNSRPKAGYTLVMTIVMAILVAVPAAAKEKKTPEESMNGFFGMEWKTTFSRFQQDFKLKKDVISWGIDKKPVVYIGGFDRKGIPVDHARAYFKNAAGEALPLTKENYDGLLLHSLYLQFRAHDYDRVLKFYKSVYGEPGNIEEMDAFDNKGNPIKNSRVYWYDYKKGRMLVLRRYETIFFCSAEYLPIYVPDTPAPEVKAQAAPPALSHEEKKESNIFETIEDFENNTLPEDFGAGSDNADTGETGGNPFSTFMYLPWGCSPRDVLEKFPAANSGNRVLSMRKFRLGAVVFPGIVFIFKGDEDKKEYLGLSERENFSRVSFWGVVINIQPEQYEELLKLFKMIYGDPARESAPEMKDQEGTVYLLKKAVWIEEISGRAIALEKYDNKPTIGSVTFYPLEE